MANGRHGHNYKKKNMKKKRKFPGNHKLVPVSETFTFLGTGK